MHSYPLHHRITVECPCCHIEHDFVFTSKSDHVICKGCVRHQGDTTLKANLRDADHVALWRSELAIARENHAEEVGGLRSVIERRDQDLARQQTEIKDLQTVVRAGVENAPLPTVERWWANEQVMIARQERDGAYRSRDHAYRALWAVDRLHHEDETRDEYCICGQRADRCKELCAIAPAVDAFLRWERNQIDRLQRGQEHGLPDEHPEVLKHYGPFRRTWYRPAG